MLATTLGLWAAFAATASATDVATGEKLARQWCANCHVIGTSAAGTVQQGPPNFTTIAHTQMTDDQLRAFLTHPHGQMPDLSLSRAEIDDLIGFIDTLR
jgi:cytochrome c